MKNNKINKDCKRTRKFRTDKNIKSSINNWDNKQIKNKQIKTVKEGKKKSKKKVVFAHKDWSVKVGFKEWLNRSY